MGDVVKNRKIILKNQKERKGKINAKIIFRGFQYFNGRFLVNGKDASIGFLSQK